MVAAQSVVVEVLAADGATKSVTGLQPLVFLGIPGIKNPGMPGVFTTKTARLRSLDVGCLFAFWAGALFERDTLVFLQ